MKKVFSLHLDFLGISASFLCVIHCLILPVLAYFGIYKGISWIKCFEIEIALLLICLCFVSFSIFKDFLTRHRNLIPLVMACSGVILFFAGLTNFYNLEILLTLIGSTCIASAHIINYKLTKAAN